MDDFAELESLWLLETGGLGEALVQIRPAAHLHCGIFSDLTDALILIEVSDDGVTRSRFKRFAVVEDLLRDETLVAAAILPPGGTKSVVVRSGKIEARAQVADRAWIAYLPAVHDGNIHVMQEGPGGYFNWEIPGATRSHDHRLPRARE
jgi:hypothetical protein